MRYSNFVFIKRITTPSILRSNSFVDYISVNVTQMEGWLWWKKERTRKRLLFKDHGDVYWRFSDTGDIVPIDLDDYIRCAIITDAVNAATAP